MSFISINYNSAYTEANRINSAATECGNIVNRNQQALSDLKTYWEGAAADEFLAANERWRKEMQSIKSELTSIGTDIRTAVDAIKRADDRAAAAARDS